MRGVCVYLRVNISRERKRERERERESVLTKARDTDPVGKVALRAKRNTENIESANECVNVEETQRNEGKRKFALNSRR